MYKYIHWPGVSDEIMTLFRCINAGPCSVCSVSCGSIVT